MKQGGYTAAIKKPILELFNRLRGQSNVVALHPNLAQPQSDENKEKNLFAKHLCDLKFFESEDGVIQNFDCLVEELRTWIEQNSSPLNKILLDLLLQEKGSQTEYKQRLRRDGTPNEIHEIIQAINFIRDLEDGMKVDNPDRILSLILSHDLGEDFGFTPELLKKHLIENGIPEDDKEMEGFLEEFAATSHHFRSERGYKKGEKIENYKNKAEYINKIHEYASATIAKFYDNIHNVNSSIFGFETQDEAARYILTIEAMLPKNKMKDLIEKHPSQATAYRQLKTTLEQSYRAIIHWVAGDLGQDLNINEENKVPDQTRLPAGLDTPEIGVNRMKIVLDKTDDNPVPAV